MRQVGRGLLFRDGAEDRLGLVICNDLVALVTTVFAFRRGAEEEEEEGKS